MADVRSSPPACFTEDVAPWLFQSADLCWVTVNCTVSIEENVSLVPSRLVQEKVYGCYGKSLAAILRHKVTVCNMFESSCITLYISHCMVVCAACREITLGKSLYLKTFWTLFWCVTGCREGREKIGSSWCGWGRCFIFLKVEMYLSHPPFCHNRLVFSYYLIAFPFEDRVCVFWRGGGGVHLGLKTNSLKNVGTKWKEAYSHGGSVSCHWPLWRAEIMCLWGFHKGYSFLDLGTRLKELPLARLGHPHKIISTHPSLHIFPLPLSRANSKNGAAWSAREWENKVHGV